VYYAEKTMKILTFIFCLFNVLILESQNIELSDFRIKINYDKNCDSINTCIDSIKCFDNTLLFSFYIKDNQSFKPERTLSYNLDQDTLFISYSYKPIEWDSIVYNIKTKKYDTLRFTSVSISVNGFESGCKKYYFSFNGISKIPYVLYNQELITYCPIDYLSYIIYQGDTINIINKNGYKEGRWIDFYETGEIRKIKEFKNGQFIIGNLYDKTGKITHVVSDEGVEVSTPIDVYNEMHK